MSIDLDVPGSKLIPVDVKKNTVYIEENKALESLLLDRSMIGLEFSKACRQASKFFFEHILYEINHNSVAELMLLSKGMFYWMYWAYADVFGQNLPINMIGTRREKVEGEQAAVRVAYKYLDADCKSLVIGDTVASGETLVTALNTYRRRRPIKRLFLFSIAGSKVGCERICEYCEQHDIDLTAVFGLALFGLGENGFDLSFSHPDTICREEYKQKAKKIYGDAQISAAGWDFGSQAQAPQKYKALCWLERQAWEGAADESIPLYERPSSKDLVKKEEDAYRYLPRQEDT